MQRLPVLALLMLSLVVTPAPITRALAPDAPQACTTIPELQGAGNASPCQGHRDDIQGRITGVTAAGFFFQDLASDGDAITLDEIEPTFIKRCVWNSWRHFLVGGRYSYVSGWAKTKAIHVEGSH